MGLTIAKEIPTTTGLNSPAGAFVYLEMNFKKGGHVAVHGWLYANKTGATSGAQNLYPSVPVLPRMDIADLDQAQLGSDNPTVIAFLHEQYKAKMVEAIDAYNQSVAPAEQLDLTENDIVIDL